MVACDLDEQIAGEVLGWKLPRWQALVLHRVLPSCGGLLVYLSLLCFDIAIIIQHFQNGDKRIAGFCIILMSLPAILSFLFTLASPPPTLHTESSAFTLKLQNNDIKWIGMQIVNLIFFPIAAIGRYCHQIFWWLEAACASYVQQEDRTRDAVQKAKAPSPLELYLFLQAFVHCAPHAVVNILNLMAQPPDPEFDRVSVQAISIIVSCMRMASTATLYRRFEREKICGRKYPWSDAELNDESSDAINNTNTEEPLYEDVSKTHEPESAVSSVISKRNTSDMIDFSPRNSNVSPKSYDYDNTSDTSSNYLHQNPVSDVTSRKHSDLDSDDEYVRPISLIEKVAPRRRDTQYTIEKVYIPALPAIDAPRPGSLSVWAERMIENAESIPVWLSAPPRNKHGFQRIPEEPEIPRRIPRSYIRGLEPQDLTASLIHYLGWYMFFVSRILSIAAFINFYPVIAIIILFSHYQVILLFLIIPPASTVKRGFYLFLAFIYLFCIMEFKIRFRHVRVWHAFWFSVCTIEIVVFTGVWATINNTLHDWWKQYVMMVIFFSLLLSYMCFLAYFLILKPKETVVYIKNKTDNENSIKYTT